ncbi:hypothetical protein BV20DRAFT_693466 [Pilatotrama ljubarskyi]|nr:hypothetical protein BV20DRAFT_693466 [Pilatotrama ljubarskyi]
MGPGGMGAGKGGTSHDAGTSQSSARAGARRDPKYARVLVVPGRLALGVLSSHSDTTLTQTRLPGCELARPKPAREELPKLLTILRRMDSEETAGSPVRRPSWTGALGAKISRILSNGEEREREEDDTLADVEVSSVKKWPRRGREMVVGGRKEGE